MRTLVLFHAHPDDESIMTGGTIARAVAQGIRVIVVVATDGSLSGDPADELRLSQRLVRARTAELEAASQILGVTRVVSLGYRDSGMAGAASNSDPTCFWRANPYRAAADLADILMEETAEALTTYDNNGFYGHPDHIQVHRVGHLAASLARTPRLFEATINRDNRARYMPTSTPDDLGKPDGSITTAVDVHEWLATKRAAMAAHASQINLGTWHLQLSKSAFAGVFGTEWYIRVRPAFEGAIPADRDDWLWPTGL